MFESAERRLPDPSSGRGSGSARASFEPLLMEILPRAYHVALRLTRDPVTAEDVVQEAALHAFRGFASFQPGSNFRAWFYRILWNAFLMRCRKEKLSAKAVSLDETPDRYLYRWLGGADPAEALLGRLEGETVARAIEGLPMPFRAVAVLYFLDDLRYAEIAEVLGCPIGTVRSRLHRGRALLQRELRAMAVDLGIVEPAQR